MKKAPLTLRNHKHHTEIRLWLPADLMALRYGPGVPFTPRQAELARKKLCGVPGCGGEGGAGSENFCPGILSDTGPHQNARDPRLVRPAPNLHSLNATSDKFLGCCVTVFHGWMGQGLYYGVCEYDPERNWIFPERALLEQENGKALPTTGWAAQVRKYIKQLPKGALPDYKEICVFGKLPDRKN